MAGLAIAPSANFSIVTLFGREPAGWQSLLPGAQATALDCAAGTRAERNLLAARLDQAVTGADRAVLLLAEGAGCLAAAWWARLSPEAYVSRVKGALFFAPSEDAPAFASPRIRLPFPSILLDDSGRDAARLRALAESWGSGMEESGDTLFTRAQRAVERFTAGVVYRDLRQARGLMGRRVR